MSVTPTASAPAATRATVSRFASWVMLVARAARRRTSRPDIGLTQIASRTLFIDRDSALQGGTTATSRATDEAAKLDVRLHRRQVMAKPDPASAACEHFITDESVPFPFDVEMVLDGVSGFTDAIV